MTSLISGINGFIGKHLADSLLSRGHKVAGIPRDLFLDTGSLTSYLIESHPNYIFHLGEYGGQKGQTDCDQMMATNIFQTYLLLRYSEQIPYEAFVYVGTSSGYGKKDKAMREDMILEPGTPYSCTKAAAEMITRMFVKPIVTVRPFSVFGEGEREGRFIPQVVSHLKSGEHLKISPNPRHDWMYVKDVAEAIVKVAENAGGLIHKIVNIGSGRQYTNLEIIKMLEKISGRVLNYTPIPKQKPQDSDYWIANNLTLKGLGFEEIYGIKAGLKRTYDYY